MKIFTQANQNFLYRLAGLPLLCLVLLTQGQAALAAPANTLPVITSNAPQNVPLSIFSDSQGTQKTSFSVRATDADAGDVVTLRVTGLPPGATLAPALPASGNPVATVFSWTPPANTPDARYTLTFTAEDSQGGQTTATFLLELHGGAQPTFVAPTPANKQLYEVQPGQKVEFTVRVEDASVLFGTLYDLRAPILPPNATFTPVVLVSKDALESTFSWTPTTADIGKTYVVYFEARDMEDALIGTVVTIKVSGTRPICDQSSAAYRPVANVGSFRTCGPLIITPAQILANATDPLGRPLQVTLTSQSQKGATLTANANGTFTFTPAPNFKGLATFYYQVLVAGRPVEASPATGHYYEFVSAPGICWAAARDAAAAHTYQGMQGYLATVTSAAEVSVLRNRRAGNYWLGGSDEEVEGEWRWKTGPEAGELFWRGAANGAAATFANWAAGEPNDYKNQYRPQGEDYASFYGESALWNDLDGCGTSGGIAGYVIEYGGLEACTPVLFSMSTIVVEVPFDCPATPAPAIAQAQAEPAQLLAASPNPSSGQFSLRVTAPADGPAQLDLYDLQGRHVQSVFAGSLQAGEVRELSVDAPQLAPGLYMVRLQSGQQLKYLRVVVQK